MLQIIELRAYFELRRKIDDTSTMELRVGQLFGPYEQVTARLFLKFGYLGLFLIALGGSLASVALVDALPASVLLRLSLSDEIGIDAHSRSTSVQISNVSVVNRPRALAQISI
jgi:hypothetical protein